MRHGFIKTAAGTPKIQVADCVYNAGEILKLIRAEEVETQEQLLAELKLRGFTTTQATISRDIKICSGRHCFWTVRESS